MGFGRGALLWLLAVPLPIVASRIVLASLRADVTRCPKGPLSIGRLLLTLHREYMSGDGSFLAGGDHANLDRTRTRANKANGRVICFRIEFEAQPAQSVADQRTHFSRVLADASGEH
jgi:hypothetical protein